jgi:hypothetical protein
VPTPEAKRQTTSQHQQEETPGTVQEFQNSLWGARTQVGTELLSITCVWTCRVYLSLFTLEKYLFILDCPASGQSSTGMNNNTEPEPVRYLNALVTDTGCWNAHADGIGSNPDAQLCNLVSQKCFGHLKKNLEMANYVFCPHTKITFCTFRTVILILL